MAQRNIKLKVTLHVADRPKRQTAFKRGEFGPFEYKYRIRVKLPRGLKIHLKIRSLKSSQNQLKDHKECNTFNLAVQTLWNLKKAHKILDSLLSQKRTREFSVNTTQKPLKSSTVCTSNALVWKDDYYQKRTRVWKNNSSISRDLYVTLIILFSRSAEQQNICTKLKKERTYPLWRNLDSGTCFSFQSFPLLIIQLAIGSFIHSPRLN